MKLYVSPSRFIMLSYRKALDLIALVQNVILSVLADEIVASKVPNYLCMMVSWVILVSLHAISVHTEQVNLLAILQMAIGTGVVDNSCMTTIAISSERIHIIIQVHYALVQKKSSSSHCLGTNRLSSFPNATILADEMEASKLPNYYLCIMVTWL